MPGIPRWCEWFDDHSWRELRDLVDREIPADDAGKPLVLGDEPPRPSVVDGPHAYALDMVQLASFLHQVNTDRWPAALEMYFERHPWPPYERRKLFTAGQAEVRPLLRLVLEKSAHVTGTPEPLQKSLGAGLTSVLTVEGRQMSHRVYAADVWRWGADPAQLWAVAMHNLRRLSAEISTLESGWRSLHGVGGSAAVNVLRLQELVTDPPHGVLVLVPTQHVLLFFPICDLDWLANIVKIKGVAEELAAKAGDEALSSAVLWWSEGWLTEIGLEPSTDPTMTHPTVVFPEGLRPLLRQYERP
jgi:hypothetical protein